MSVSSVKDDKINPKNSFFGFIPPPLEENHTSRAFHRTLGTLSPPQTPPYIPPQNLTFSSNQQIPILPLHPITRSPPLSAAKTTVKHQIHPTFSLNSCTESLGFESSDEMMSSSFNDLGNPKKCDYNEDSNSITCCTSYRLRKKWEEKKFPPPLTSLSENGRRNFVLKSTRKDGRLEIVGVMIQRPQILCASRDNGRLRLNLVIDNDDDDDDENIEENNYDEEKKEKEKENWKINSGFQQQQQRCFKREMHVWGPQSHHNTCVASV